MPELSGQLHSGSAMSERDCFQQAVHHVQCLRDCFRGLALLRGDERWLVPARNMEGLEDGIKRLMVAKHRPFLIMPR